MRRVYFDNAATTPVRKEVLEAMLPFYQDLFGNPSSVHSFGREARKAIDEAREKVAKALGAEPSEIYFTGSGTEADNWAIYGVAEAQAKKGKHIITSAIEHHAVLHSCEHLEKLGYKVTYIPVDQDGLVNPADVEKAITPETVLITIMHANNEIGTIQPIAEIGEIARKHNITFHTDAVQTVGAIPVNVNDLKVDLLSLSAHKFNGPKGVGALYIRKGTKINNFVYGGAQERSRRAGTENVAGIVGLATALDLAVAELPEHQKHLTGLRDQLLRKIPELIPHVKLNGHPTKRLPGNVNFSFRFLEGESILLTLDMNGIAASSGSACTSGSLDPSHVLLAIGLPHEIAHGSVRMSLGRINTQEDVDYVLEKLPGIIERLRHMSPLFAEHLKEMKEDCPCTTKK